MSKLYVAYGSNLNMKQMKMRCPTAALYGKGIIENYELQFKGVPGNSHATIEPKEGSSVPVAVFEIQPNDEMMLDRYEGYPSYYFKQDVPVKLGNENINAMVYIMDLNQDFGPPSAYYYETVYNGYKDCGFDVKGLNKAVEKSIDKYNLAVEESTLFGCDETDDFDESEDSTFGYGGMQY